MIGTETQQSNSDILRDRAFGETAGHIGRAPAVESAQEEKGAPRPLGGYRADAVQALLREAREMDRIQNERYRAGEIGHPGVNNRKMLTHQWLMLQADELLEREYATVEEANEERLSAAEAICRNFFETDDLALIFGGKVYAMSAREKLVHVQDTMRRLMVLQAEDEKARRKYVALHFGSEESQAWERKKLSGAAQEELASYVLRNMGDPSSSFDRTAGEIEQDFKSSAFWSTTTEEERRIFNAPEEVKKPKRSRIRPRVKNLKSVKFDNSSRKHAEKAYKEYERQMEAWFKTNKTVINNHRLISRYEKKLSENSKIHLLALSALYLPDQAGELVRAAASGQSVSLNAIRMLPESDRQLTMLVMNAVRPIDFGSGEFWSQAGAGVVSAAQSARKFGSGFIASARISLKSFENEEERKKFAAAFREEKDYRDLIDSNKLNTPEGFFNRGYRGFMESTPHMAAVALARASYGIPVVGPGVGVAADAAIIMSYMGNIASDYIGEGMDPRQAAASAWLTGAASYGVERLQVIDRLFGGKLTPEQMKIIRVRAIFKTAQQHDFRLLNEAGKGFAEQVAKTLFKETAEETLQQLIETGGKGISEGLSANDLYRLLMDSSFDTIMEVCPTTTGFALFGGINHTVNNNARVEKSLQGYAQNAIDLMAIRDQAGLISAENHAAALEHLKVSGSGIIQATEKMSWPETMDWITRKNKFSETEKGFYTLYTMAYRAEVESAGKKAADARFASPLNPLGLKEAGITLNTAPEGRIESLEKDGKTIPVVYSNDVDGMGGKIVEDHTDQDIVRSLTGKEAAQSAHQQNILETLEKEGRKDSPEYRDRAALKAFYDNTAGISFDEKLKAFAQLPSSAKTFAGLTPETARARGGALKAGSSVLVEGLNGRVSEMSWDTDVILLNMDASHHAAGLDTLLNQVNHLMTDDARAAQNDGDLDATLERHYKTGDRIANEEAFVNDVTRTILRNLQKGIARDSAGNPLILKGGIQKSAVLGNLVKGLVRLVSFGRITPRLDAMVADDALVRMGEIASAQAVFDTLLKALPPEHPLHPAHAVKRVFDKWQRQRKRQKGRHLIGEPRR